MCWQMTAKPRHFNEPATSSTPPARPFTKALIWALPPRIQYRHYRHPRVECRICRCSTFLMIVSQEQKKNVLIVWLPSPLTSAFVHLPLLIFIATAYTNLKDRMGMNYVLIWSYVIPCSSDDTYQCEWTIVQIRTRDSSPLCHPKTSKPQALALHPIFWSVSIALFGMATPLSPEQLTETARNLWVLSSLYSFSSTTRFKDGRQDVLVGFMWSVFLITLCV